MVRPLGCGLTGRDIDGDRLIVARAIQHAAVAIHITIVIRTVHCYHLDSLSGFALVGDWRVGVS